MDESEKDKVVRSYFAAAEAMVMLETLADKDLGKTVSPISMRRIIGSEANSKNDDVVNSLAVPEPELLRGNESSTVPNSELVKILDWVQSTKTGAEAHLEEPELIKTGYLSIAATGSRTPLATKLVFWEDMEKHQWLLDVLSDLEVYAAENSLAETAESLSTARCELISRAARAR